MDRIQSLGMAVARLLPARTEILYPDEAGRAGSLRTGYEEEDSDDDGDP